MHDIHKDTFNTYIGNNCIILEALSNNSTL